MPEEASRSWWVLLGATALGATLRIYHFADPPLWLDEYGTQWVVAGTSYAEAAARAVDHQGQSPLYYLVAKLACDLFGTDAASLRLPSLVFGIATVMLAYPLAVAAFGSVETGRAAVVAFAVSEPLISYAQDARPYALALLAAVASFLFHLKLIERITRGRQLGYVLATAAAYYAHYLFGFIVLVQAAHVLWADGRGRIKDRRWWLTWTALAIALAPGAFQLASLFSRRRALDWIGDETFQTPFRLAAELLDAKVFALVTLFVILGRNTLAERPRPGLVFGWFALPVLFFSVIPPLLGAHLGSSRYVLFAVPAALLLSAWVMSSAAPLWRASVAQVLFVALAFVFSLFPAASQSPTFSRRPNEGWVKAAGVIEAQAAPADLIVYRTGFVEADLLAQPGADPEVASFVSWPLLAHLTDSRAQHMVSLPYREDDSTRAYVEAVLHRASMEHRVWFVGSGSGLGELARKLVQGRGFQVVRRDRFPLVEVIGLERVASSDE